MGFWSSGIYDTSFDPLPWAVGDPLSNHNYIYFNVYIAFISFLFILDISLIKNALERTYAYLMTFDAHWHHPMNHDIGHVFPPVFFAPLCATSTASCRGWTFLGLFLRQQPPPLFGQIGKHTQKASAGSI